MSVLFWHVYFTIFNLLPETQWLYFGTKKSLDGSDGNIKISRMSFNREAKILYPVNLAWQLDRRLFPHFPDYHFQRLVQAKDSEQLEDVDIQPFLRQLKNGKATSAGPFDTSRSGATTALPLFLSSKPLPNYVDNPLDVCYSTSQTYHTTTREEIFTKTANTGHSPALYWTLSNEALAAGIFRTIGLFRSVSDVREISDLVEDLETVEVPVKLVLPPIPDRFYFPGGGVFCLRAEIISNTSPYPPITYRFI